MLESPCSQHPTAADQAAKRDARECWEADRAWLVFNRPFLATLAMHLDIVPVVDGRVKTACTDGERLYVNPYFLDDLSQPDRLFVLAHEIWHCALLHLGREAGRDPRLWNLAIDHEANALLIEDGLEMPADGVFFSNLVGLNAEEVHRLLEEEALATPPVRGRLADQHLPADPAALAVTGKVDPDFLPGMRREVLERWPQRLVAAAQQHERTAGAIPGGLRRHLEALRRPSVLWQRVLRQFVTSTFGGERRWLPPGRRHVHRGLYLPSRRQEQVRLVVALDTSGSTVFEIPQFLGELQGIVESFGRYEVTVIQCDQVIQGVDVYTPERPLPVDRGRGEIDIDIVGGGGTSFIPVFDWVAEREPPDALVYLTDGWGEAPDRAPGYPMLWALTDDGDRPAGWGQATRIRPPEHGWE